jgi:dTDP-4-dehydrorhamnose 3,5-epimerase
MDNEIKDIFEISSPTHPDERGFFREILRTESLKSRKIEFSVKQVNHARSSQNTLRGIHIAPWNKIIYVPRGKVQCVIVDCRNDSPTIGKHSSFVLGDDNHRAVFVPAGCGNSYLVLSEDADYIYFTDQEWEAGKEIDIFWNDPELKIDWLFDGEPSLSERDKNASLFSQLFPEFKREI